MFKKAENEQGSITINIYGEAGSGKSFTALLIAEGLAKQCGKRVAVIDNEKGFEFYASKNDNRYVHKDAFDFDIERTKSIFDAIKAAEFAINSKDHGVIIVDSVSGFYEAAKSSWSGKKTSAGTYPIYAWNTIYQRYDALVRPLLDSGKHVIFCGRMGNMYGDSGDGGEMKVVGKRMKAKGDQAYETNVLLQMSPIIKNGKTEYSLFVEKDRSSVLLGETVMWPTFKNTVSKMIPYLSSKHVPVASADDMQTAIKIDHESKKLLDSMSSKIKNCKNKNDLESVKPDLGKAKESMTRDDVAELTKLFLEKSESFDAKADSVLGRIK